MTPLSWGILAGIAVVGGMWIRIKMLMDALGKTKQEKADAIIEGEVKVNEYKVNEATARANASLEYYKNLKSRNNNGSK